MCIFERAVTTVHKGYESAIATRDEFLLFIESTLSGSTDCKII